MAGPLEQSMARAEVAYFDHEGSDCKDRYHRRCTGRWRGELNLGKDARAGAGRFRPRTKAELQIKHLQIYAGWLELPIGMQLDMWGKPAAATVDAKAAEEQREWAAGGKGYEAGEAGHERETNPHEPGSAEYAAWDKSWARGHKVFLNGQKKIAGEMGKAANGANGHTAPRKRGRPRSSEAQAASQ